MGRALFLLLLVAGMGVQLPKRCYSGNLLGVHVSVTPISNHQARVVLSGGGVGAHVEGIATTRPRNKVVLDRTLYSVLSGRLCAVESAQYSASGDALCVRMTMPLMNATLRMLRDGADGPRHAKVFVMD